MLSCTRKLKVDLCLAHTVRELLLEVPENAFDIFVVVHMNYLHDVEGAHVKVGHLFFPVRFDRVFENNSEVGDIWIGFGVGNLE